MPASNRQIEQFLRAYERDTVRGDIPTIVSHFADIFMAAGPQGASCVRAEDFALALPKRKQLFDQFGSHSTELIGFDAQPLNERFCMAQTQWKMSFLSGDRPAEEILVGSTFIVDTGVDPFKFVFYLPAQDLLSILKERAAKQN